VPYLLFSDRSPTQSQPTTPSIAHHLTSGDHLLAYHPPRPAPPRPSSTAVVHSTTASSSTHADITCMRDIGHRRRRVSMGCGACESSHHKRIAIPGRLQPLRCRSISASHHDLAPFGICRSTREWYSRYNTLVAFHCTRNPYLTQGLRSGYPLDPCHITYRYHNLHIHCVSTADSTDVSPSRKSSSTPRP
jgi:hypothetical protein